MLKNIMEASKIIRIDGVDGFRSASKIVGQETALAMLVLLLRVQLNTESQYPEPTNIENDIEALLKKHDIPYWY